MLTEHQTSSQHTSAYRSSSCSTCFGRFSSERTGFTPPTRTSQPARQLWMQKMANGQSKSPETSSRRSGSALRRCHDMRGCTLLNWRKNDMGGPDGVGLQLLRYTQCFEIARYLTSCSLIVLLSLVMNSFVFVFDPPVVAGASKASFCNRQKDRVQPFNFIPTIIGTLRSRPLHWNPKSR